MDLSLKFGLTYAGFKHVRCTWTFISQSAGKLEASSLLLNFVCCSKKLLLTILFLTNADSVLTLPFPTWAKLPKTLRNKAVCCHVS